VEVKQRVTLHFRRQASTLGGVGFVCTPKTRQVDLGGEVRQSTEKKEKEKEDSVANRQSGKVDFFSRRLACEREKEKIEFIAHVLCCDDD